MYQNRLRHARPGLWMPVIAVAVFLVAVLLSAAPTARAIDVAAADKSPKADAAEDIPALVKQLGDADFKVREAATERLKDLGPAALSALKDAIALGEDPEVCSRADSIVRQLERPQVPASWLGPDGFGGRGFGATQMTTSNIGGARRIEVQDGSGRRRVSIVERPTGLEMTVVGVDDASGENFTATFRARNPADLRDKDPNAYRVYQRWAGNGGPNGAFMRGRRLVVPPAGQAQFRFVAPPDPQLRPPADDLSALELRVRRNLIQGKVPPDQRRPVEDLLRQLQEIQAEGQAVEPGDWNKQIERYNLLSDALRDKLKTLKLPDPGDALPPPAKSRLGISVSAVPQAGGAAGGMDDGLTVARVVPDSRAQKMGLKEGDVVRKVNGKAVADTAALRRAVTEAAGPLVLDIVRNGKPQTVREQPQP